MNPQQKGARWWLLLAFMAGVAVLIAMISLFYGEFAVLAQSDIEWPELEFVSVATGLSSPVHITHAGDGSGRLFIVLQGGQIRILENGTLLGSPFLNISSLVSNGSEQGLLGLAFSPNYASNGEFYVNYTDTSGDTRIVRYQVSDDPNLADPDSAQIVLAVEQDFANHNGGQVAFGPDGYLYIGMGDGGSAGDPNNRAQDPNQLLGKMLRIDVETENPSTYTIPPDNPFVGDPSTLDEIWALGVRNPWRFSFDRLTGDMYIADVGQNQWEEIDFQPAESTGGENYGWRCYEGNHTYNTSGCGTIDEYDFPVSEFSHSGGNCSVTGGFVYRGSVYPRMAGVYFYADYCSGNLWGLQYIDQSWQNTLLFTNQGFGMTSFGEDEAGNLYLAKGSTIYELTDPNGSTPTPTGSVIATNTPTHTPTLATSTAINSPSATATTCSINTPPATPTGCMTATNTPTRTATGSLTATNTPTRTATGSVIATNTPTHTPTLATSTAINSPSATATTCAINTPPATPTGCMTATNTPTNTPTSSPTAVKGGIRGTVMAADGSLLSHILVQAYQQEADWLIAAQATTDISGTYTLESLMPGSYRLYFSDASQSYVSEYYSDTTNFDNSQSIIVKTQFIEQIDAILDTAAPPVATTEGNAIVNVDPETGQLTIGTQNNAQESITITTHVTCDVGEASNVMFMLGDESFKMTSTDENNYRVTLDIPDDLPNAQPPYNLEVTYDCSGDANTTQIGQLTLYDPSGTITNRTTGEVIAGATVNLYYLTDRMPDTADEQNGECRTVNSRPDVEAGIYGAWSGLEAAELESGVWVNPAVLTINSTQAISPTINPQTTGNNGRYGWDVAEGCWYVVVQADGYQSLISPLVGIPPEVTDLDMALAPLQTMELYLPLISRD